MRVAERKRQAKAFVRNLGVKPQNDHQTITVLFDREGAVGYMSHIPSADGMTEHVNTPVLTGVFPDTGRSRMLTWKAMQAAKYWFVCFNRSVYGEWRIANADRC